MSSYLEPHVVNLQDQGPSWAPQGCRALQLFLDLNVVLPVPRRAVFLASHRNSMLALGIAVTRGHPQGWAPWVPLIRSLAA